MSRLVLSTRRRFAGAFLLLALFCFVSFSFLLFSWRERVLRRFLPGFGFWLCFCLVGSFVGVLSALLFLMFGVAFAFGCAPASAFNVSFRCEAGLGVRLALGF